MNKLKLIIVPSYTEGLLNIMLEAMACGTPVLATPVGAIPDVIKDSETGFIIENNSPEWVIFHMEVGTFIGKETICKRSVRNEKRIINLKT